MIEINKHIKKKLLKLREDDGIVLEGHILKLIDAGDEEEFQSYIHDCIEMDKKTQLELSKSQKENDRVNRQMIKALDQAEEANVKMIKAKNDAIKAKDEAEASKIEALHQKRKAEKARAESENSKNTAENDLELIQKKSQFELIGKIVKASLWVIAGVGIVTTLIYLYVLINGLDSVVIASTWTNIISILLTNSFSIIGTIMGVKYATESKD